MLDDLFTKTCKIIPFGDHTRCSNTEKKKKEKKSPKHLPKHNTISCNPGE